MPLMYHPPLHVLFFYVVAMMTTGLTLSLIFILPHGVEEATFPLPEKETGRIADPRAVHQVHVTVDFARRNSLMTWLVGGLNFHREHHLFPAVNHAHYPKIAGIVDMVCEEFEIPHIEHRSYLAGLASHYRWLKKLGREDTVV
jgi:linoleoyl-CoA desaturase